MTILSTIIYGLITSLIAAILALLLNPGINYLKTKCRWRKLEGEWIQLKYNLDNHYQPTDHFAEIKVEKGNILKVKFGNFDHIWEGQIILEKSDSGFGKLIIGNTRCNAEETNFPKSFKDVIFTDEKHYGKTFRIIDNGKEEFFFVNKKNYLNFFKKLINAEKNPVVKKGLEEDFKKIKKGPDLFEHLMHSLDTELIERILKKK